MPRYLFVAVVIWPMCCHTAIPFRRHSVWHPRPVTVYRHMADLSMCYLFTIDLETSHWNTQLPNCPMSCVRPDRETLPRPSAHTSTQLYDAVMVVVSQKLGRKCTVPSESWTRELWCANPLRYPLANNLVN